VAATAVAAVVATAAAAAGTRTGFDPVKMPVRR